MLRIIRGKIAKTALKASAWARNAQPSFEKRRAAARKIAIVRLTPEFP